MLAINEQFLPAGATFKISLANENHWLQPMLVLTVHWWPTPVSVWVGYHLLTPLHSLVNGLRMKNMYHQKEGVTLRHYDYLARNSVKLPPLVPQQPSFQCPAHHRHATRPPIYSHTLHCYMLA